MLYGNIKNPKMTFWASFVSNKVLCSKTLEWAVGASRGCSGRPDILSVVRDLILQGLQWQTRYSKCCQRPHLTGAAVADQIF